MLLALSFIYFSKILNKISNINDIKPRRDFIIKINKLFFIITILIGLIFIILLNIFSNFFNNIYEIRSVLSILILSQIILAKNFGYGELFIIKVKKIS